MPATDSSVSYYAPACKIELDGSELDAPILHSILSVRVEQTLNRVNSFVLEFTDEFSDGRLQLLEKGLFKVGAKVAVALGYADAVQEIIEGKIKNIGAAFDSGSAPRITIEGVDPGYEFLTTPSEARTFKEMTDSDIVEEVAGLADLDADVESTSHRHAVKTKAGGRTYLEFLEELADDNGFEFRTVDGTVYFGTEQERRPVAKFAWGRDIARFEPTLNTTEAVSEVIVRGWNGTGKRTIEGRATVGSESSLEGSKQRSSEVVQELFGPVTKVITDRPVRSVDEAEKIAEAELRRCSERLLSATLETVGVPDLAPGVPIEIEGCGSIFSGTYYVYGASHSFGTDGYRTRLELRRNAL